MKALSQTCDAVFVAIGAHAAKKLRLPGIDAKGVISAVDMLRSIGDGVYPDYRGKKIAVIGGGMSPWTACAPRCAREQPR